jgi:hypothetical protein
MAGAFPPAERSAVMSTTSFVAIAVVIMLASVVYEFTVVSRFIAKQRPKQRDERAHRP